MEPHNRRSTGEGRMSSERRSTNDSSKMVKTTVADSNDLETSKKWIAEYLSGMDEDDFRNRYFKEVQETEDQKISKANAELAKKQAAAAKSAANKKKEAPKEANESASRQTAETEVIVPPSPGPRNSLGMPVTKTSDILAQRMNRTDDETRADYIATLKLRKVLVPSVKEQKITIFDWDDTLICTTYLGKMKGLVDMNIGERDRRILNKIDETARYIHHYECCKRLGRVQQSVEEGIKIISARSDFEKKFPGETKRWKREAFVEISKRYSYNIRTNIVCLGDSNIEMEAAKQFEDQSSIKTVKFEDKPDPISLIKQQIHVADKFDRIFKTYKSRMIRLEKLA